MRQLTILGLVVLFSAAASLAQEASAVPLSPDDLYRQAHDRLAGVTPVENKAYALASLLHMSGARPQLLEIASWAEEAFNLSLQMPAGARRAYVQEIAIMVLSRRDPDRALALLDRLDARPPETLNSFSVARGQSTASIFDAVLARHGPSMVPTLLQTAEQLGAKGLYPYLAMGSLMSHSVPEGASKVLNTAVAHYQQSRPSIGNDFEFVMFLESLRYRSSYAPSAATQIAARLERFAGSDVPCRSTFRLYTDKGMVALNCGERMIYTALPALEKMDPAIVLKLKANHPVLRQLDGAKVQTIMPTANQGDPSSATAQRSQAELDVGILLRNMSREDPDRAEQLAQQLPEDAIRLNTTAQIAAQTAQNDPAKSRQMLDGVLNEINKVNDLRWKMTLLSNIADTAAKLGDGALFEATLRADFALAGEFAKTLAAAPVEQRLIWASNGYRLVPITRQGARVAPQVTLSLIPTLQDAEGEAYLLMNLANALYWPPPRSVRRE